MEILDGGRLEGLLERATIPGMKAQVTSLPTTAARSRRVDHVIDARRRLQASAEQAFERGGGRAWINGDEVGGTHPGLSHLESSYD